MGRYNVLCLVILTTLFFSNFAAKIVVKRYQIPTKKDYDYRELDLPINITYQSFKGLLLSAFDASKDDKIILGLLLKPYGRVMFAHELESVSPISLKDRKALLEGSMLVVYFNDYSARDIL
jgi:hypothetical protein